MLDFSEAIGAELSVAVDVSGYTHFSGHYHWLLVHKWFDIVDYYLISIFVYSYFGSAGSLISRSYD